jgi:error-prone DNA polymerase
VVELHAHSAYSFLDGASEPAELAAAAADLDMEALALTDHDNVCGAMEFAHACRGVGVRPIHGVELTVKKGDLSAHVTLLVESAAGWANLCRLVTRAHEGTREGGAMGGDARREALPPSIPLDDLEGDTDGLVCLSGCPGEGLVAGAWERDDPRGAAGGARRVCVRFGPEGVRVELERPQWRRGRAPNRRRAARAGGDTRRGCDGWGC